MPIELAEAWLLAAVIVAGLAAGSLGLLLLGRLLGRDWVTPLDDELLPAALAMPVAALIALPVAFMIGGLYPWTEEWEAPSPALSAWFEPAAFLLRSACYFGLWTLLALIAARRDSRNWSALLLALLLPSAGLAGIDWLLSREPFWWSSLFGFAFAVSQLAPALGLAFLANAVQREHVGRLHDRSLTSALLTLALAALGLWFVQFLAAWMGNLPEEALWYEARLVDGRWIPFALAAAMLGVAVLLLLQRHRGDFTILAAAALIVGQHILHMSWLLRPAGTPPLNIVDLGMLLLLGGLWLLAWAALIRRHNKREGQSGRFGSSKRGRSGGTSGGQTIASSD